MLDLGAYFSHSPITLLLLAVLAVYVPLYILSRRKIHPLEPPIMPSPIPIPYIGHLIGMALQGGHYIKTLGTSHPGRQHPIFTLAMPFSRLYVVTSPSLAISVQRKPARQLSNSALMPELTQRVFGLDDATRALVELGLDPEPGAAPADRGFVADMHDMIYGFLGPGPDLDALTLSAVCDLTAEADARFRELRGQEEGVEAVDLLLWLRDIVTLATARLLYGERNPFATAQDKDGGGSRSAERRLIEAFWDFDHGIGGLLVGIKPWLTAAKAYRGRESMVSAFKEYLSERHFEEDAEEERGRRNKGASRIVFNRLRIAREHDFSLDATARAELSFLFAGIINTTIASFWTLVRIIEGDNGLLRAVREELTCAGGPVRREGSRLKLSVDALTKDSCAACPTLHAVYKETLRLGSNNFSARLVMADTTLTGASHEGAFFLRQGSIVQIAGGVMHADRSIWGHDALEFRPERHLTKKSNRNNSDDNKERGSAVNPAAFRSFGGGKTMCPGRHFATGEVLSLVAYLVLRFDFEAVGADGRSGVAPAKIRVPEMDDYILPVHILEPVAKNPVTVSVRVREGQEKEEGWIVGIEP